MRLGGGLLAENNAEQGDRESRKLVAAPRLNPKLQDSGVQHNDPARALAR